LVAKWGDRLPTVNQPFDTLAEVAYLHDVRPSSNVSSTPFLHTSCALFLLVSSAHRRDGPPFEEDVVRVLKDHLAAGGVTLPSGASKKRGVHDDELGEETPRGERIGVMPP
jgi:hypothetical protein